MPAASNGTESRVTLHVVSSIDGFIARKDNNISWLENGNLYEVGVSVSEQEAAAFVKAIDCYVLGSRTYEHALELGWPYGDTPTIVVTSRKLPKANKIVQFYSGDLKTLVKRGARGPISQHLARRWGHLMSALSRTRPRPRNSPDHRSRTAR